MGDHWVYVFARRSPAGLTGPVKVGISGNVSVRLAAVQTTCPFEIDVAYSFRCPNRDAAEAIERSFHETQGEHREYGEWFSFEPGEAIQLLCASIRIMLHVHVRDPETIQAALDLSGVLWAEQHFNLIAPAPESLQ